MEQRQDTVEAREEVEPPTKEFPMSPSIEYLESNVDEDEEYDDEEYDDDKLGTMRETRQHAPLLPPPTSISSLRLSQPDRVK